MRNRRNTIRLNESTLNRIIKESVKRVLKESEYMDDGDLEPQFDEFPLERYRSGYDYYNPYYIRNSGKGNKKADNAGSWDYFDVVRNGARNRMASMANVEHSIRAGKPTYTDKEVKQEWINSRHLPHIGGTYYGFPTAYDDFKKELDKRWENQIEAEKYEKMADTRPLHRKGSLNRELDEKIRR